MSHPPYRAVRTRELADGQPCSEGIEFGNPMTGKTEPSIARLLAALALFLAFGGLATYFLWHNLSELLYGRIHNVSVPGLLGGAIALAITVWVLGRWVRHLAA